MLYSAADRNYSWAIDHSDILNVKSQWLQLVNGLCGLRRYQGGCGEVLVSPQYFMAVLSSQCLRAGSSASDGWTALFL